MGFEAFLAELGLPGATLMAVGFLAWAMVRHDRRCGVDKQETKDRLDHIDERLSAGNERFDGLQDSVDNINRVLPRRWRR